MLHETFFVISVPPSIVSGVVWSSYTSSVTSGTLQRKQDRVRDFSYFSLWSLILVSLLFYFIFFAYIFKP